jgi:predicted AAA+ superfamily ATPase
MEPVMPKRFNVAGPCIPDRHYMLPAVNRLPEARQLAERGDYFVVHAARQSGKTTLLQALTDEINAEGRHYALYCSLEELQ